MKSQAVPIKSETIWITGGSSGIGYALVEKLAKDNKVIVSARNASTLKELEDQFPNVYAVVFDVSDKTQIDRVTDELAQITNHLDRVILNAGHCEYLDIKEPDWCLMERMIKVNFLGMVHSLQACLPLLQKAKAPHLIGVSSLAIVAPFTQAEGYGASKAAVQYWLDSIRIDLVKLNIDVTSILPGFVNTPLTQKNTFSMPFLMSSERAAERILHAIAKRKITYAFPKRLVAMLWMARKFPKSWLKLQQNAL
ncbi:SDR family NAD(P)-dependent oxidoreductase [Marinomonas sp. 2405UD68-3]|uniref:SDR family NAD(P)-dependent oxidoreductase n=1 Tax=Marinomonas sp. 2405UD68-3 TaxID=3391835 RepID=UPI0039C8E02D